MPRYRLVVDGGAVVGHFDAAVESHVRLAARRLAVQVLADRGCGPQCDHGRAAFVLQQQVEDERWRFVLGWVSRWRPSSAPVPRASGAPHGLVAPAGR